MSAPDNPVSSPKRRLKWRRWALGGAALAGGAGLTLGPLAPVLVDQFGDGVEVWRLGKLRIDGVSGSSLAHLKAARISISDGSGVWFEADNLVLDWRPLALLRGAAHLDRVKAGGVRVLRQPVLSPAKPDHGGAPDVTITALDLPNIALDRAALGAEAQFKLTLSLALNDNALRALDMDLARIDSDADHFSAHYRDRALAESEIDLSGAPGGVFARLFGASEQPVGFEAVGEGDDQNGGVRFEGAVGDHMLARGGLNWTPRTWSLKSETDLARIPGLDELARRIGANLTLQGEGARSGMFTLDAHSNFVDAQMRGSRAHGLTLSRPAHIVADTQRTSDIAPEAPLELGAAHLEGSLKSEDDGFSFDVALIAHEISILGRTTEMSGPVRGAWRGARFSLDASLRAAENAPDLFRDARLTTSLSWDHPKRLFTLERTTLQGASIDIDARGWANGGGEGEFDGQWRAKDLTAVLDILRGGASGHWRAMSNAPERPEAGRVWGLSLEGQGENFASEPAIVGQLAGRAPRIGATLRFENGGTTARLIRVDGTQLRAAAQGRIVRGVYDLAVEASARGPADAGGAQFRGVVDASGHMGGALARPSLNIRARTEALAVSGVDIAQPIVDFTLDPDGGAYRGHARVEGTAFAQKLIAEADLRWEHNVVVLPNLNASLGNLRGSGAGRFTARGPEAMFSLAGALDGLAPDVAGSVRGDVSLQPETISIDVALERARYGELRLRTATISAAGPYRAIAGRVDVSGALKRAPLRFAGAMTLNVVAPEIQLTGQGLLAETPFTTRAPIIARGSDDVREVSLDVAIDTGTLAGQWRERGRALSGSVAIADAPLAPLAAIWGERAIGRISGDAHLANEGERLSGALNLHLNNARFAARSRGVMDLDVSATLNPDRLSGVVDARSSGGLVAHFSGEAPVETAATPIRIALQPNRSGHAAWSVRGPAESLWAAARLDDQALSGALDGEGELNFGAGALSGSGRIALSGGRFEDKATGVKLEELNAALAIGAQGLTLESFNARDSRGGRLSATGGSDDPRRGQVSLSLDDLQLIDRPDMKARASGDLQFTWEGMNSSLSGALNFTEANINVAQSPAAGIPQLDVVEINLPETAIEDEASTQPRERAGTQLDIALKAPGRVFTRGRGLDAEWSLDLALKGTLAKPLLYGSARTVRGELRLSGQPFTIDTGRLDFDGDMQDARIDLTAERVTADLTARVALSGTANDPDVALSSTPALPEDEILPQILFGRSMQDLSGIEAAQLAASLAALSGQSSFDLIDAARSVSGLDRFALRPDEDGGWLVAGGVYLTRDVYVEVARTGLGQARTQVEWTIKPQLVLITSFLPNGDQRASVRWRHEGD